MPKTENKTHPETASDADTENGRLYRIYASAGNPLDSGTYRFVAEFARRKAAEKYAKYIQKKKRFSDKSILIKEVLTEEPAAEEGELVVVLSPLGELPAPKKAPSIFSPNRTWTADLSAERASSRSISPS